MQPKVPNIYKVPENPQEVAVSPAFSLVKNVALSAVYGIGINQAVLKQNAPKQKEKPAQVEGYDPDAQVQNGGYVATDRWDGYMSSALAGMPVMSYVKFNTVDYLTLDGRTVNIPEIIFETVLLSVTINKNNKKTTITGKDTGSVKEYIGLGDFDVELRVIITSDAPVNSSITKRHQDGVYPRENMEAITKMMLAPISIPVTSWFLQQFGINYLVVESGVRVEQIEGEYSMQRLIIPCVSDSPLIIKTIP